MRKNQITLTIDRYSEQSKNGHDKITIYSDSNNIYEALSGAYLIALEKIGNPSIASSVKEESFEINH